LVDFAIVKVHLIQQRERGEGPALSISERSQSIPFSFNSTLRIVRGAFIGRVVAIVEGAGRCLKVSAERAGGGENGVESPAGEDR
jgi:hypothetical protein